MNDVAPPGANIQANLLELMCEVLDAAVFVTDKFDCLTFASKRLLKHFPLPEARLQPGTRVRDLFGAIFDCGIRMTPGGEDPLAGMTREEWIADRIAMNWRERHDAVLHLGRDRWVQLVHRRTANATGITAFIDISEQKKREIHWRADVERVKLTEDILDNLPTPVFVQDEHLHFVAVNRAFCQLQQTTADNLIGRSIFDLFAPDLAQDFEEASRTQLQTGQKNDALLHMRRPDGRDLTLVTTSARIGRPGSYFLANVFCDVSDHAEGLSRAPDPQWADGNPFARGLGPFEHMPEFDTDIDFEFELPEPLDETNHIQDVALPREPENAPMTDLAEPFVLESGADADVAPAIDHGEPESEISFDIGDNLLVERPIRNVIVLSSPDGQGDVLVRHFKGYGHDACCLHDPGELHAFTDAAREAGLSVDVIIIDGLSTGDWDHEDLKAACHHASRHGIASHILPRHADGRVDVNRLDALLMIEQAAWQPGNFPGSTPILAEAPPLLPIEPLGRNHQVSAQATLADQPPPQREPVDVLVVEDNPVNRCVFEQVLESLSLRHRIAGTAAEALEQFHNKRPSIMFIDLTLPDMDGAELAREITIIDRRGPPIPMIAVMGRHDFMNETRALAAGMKGILVKPISPDMIDGLIRDHVLGATRQVEIVR